MFTLSTCYRHERVWGRCGELYAACNIIQHDHHWPMANLQILVFSGKCQWSCTVLGCEHRSHYRMSNPHATLIESVLAVWSETCTQVTRRRSFCRHLAVFLVFFLAQRRRYQSCRWVVAFLQPDPGVLVYWPISRYLLHTLETVLGDTANLLTMARMDVPSWRSWATCAP